MREQKICWIDERNDIIRLNHARMVQKWLLTWCMNTLLACLGVILIVAAGRLILWLLAGIGPVAYITR